VDTDWGVIFDMDGLLVDSEPIQARSFNIVLARYGIHLADCDFEELVGQTTEENFRTLKKRFSLPETVEELLAAKEEAYRELVPRELLPRPGAPELVAELAEAGVKLAIASSSPCVDVRLCLDAVGLAERFPTVVTADDVEHAKPAPDLYLLASDRLGLSTDRCVAFEDSGSGVVAATAAGIRCFAVPHIFTKHHDFSRAIAVLESLADISASKLARLVNSPR